MGLFWWLGSTETWVLLLVLLGLVLMLDHRAKSLFRNLGIPGPGYRPFFGTIFEYMKGFHTFDTKCFQKFGRVWGIFDVWQPLLCVMDTEIIKTVLIKECHTLFTNRRDFPLNGELYDAVTVVEDDNWRRIRNILSPSFTSGRLKEMFGIMKKHSSTLIKHLQKTAEQGGTVDLKGVFGPYSMDVIASTAFSVDIDSLNNPDDPFVTNAKKLQFNFENPVFIIGALLPFTMPLLEKMNFSFFPDSVTKFFYAAVQKIKAEQMINQHKSRVDFLQLMMDSQKSDQSDKGKETHKGLTDHEILSQAMIFIFAGYETSSSTLTFFFYNIATNPEAMKKLQQEVDRTFPNWAPVLYDALVSMDYLDAAMSESMRLYPVVPRLERQCKKTVEICGVTVTKGTVVMIPTYVLHRDPEYWPDPETFNPLRFTKGNKENVDPYVYMPFGSGPRNCIGMRFAQLAMKLAIVEILQRFNVQVCDQTQVPLQLAGALLTTLKPIILKFTPRADSSN
ncbi:cytochrome P450 3A27 [Astyanax mexicanus]|uniref:cytochrome P450 3A27 n=1 Tax=Astyanax mexicanus TaxID=7994 RepID=UPI0020CB1722|nr:cytochrome P450 3A27 [Astyanax mexicanus]